MYLGAFEVLIGAHLGYQFFFQASVFVTLPIWSIPPTTTRMSIDYIEVTLVSLHRLSRGYFVRVILQVSRLGWGQTAQSLYALKLRATIIGYEPLLVVYVSLKPLLGETHQLHSGAHLSYP